MKSSALHKVKAFSINEMVVVLLLTTIVVGMAFSVLNLVQQQMGSIQAIYEVKTEANKLRQALWLDFNRYAKVTYDQKKETLTFSNEMGSQEYQVANGLFIREKDTFDIKLDTKKFYFANQERSSGEIDALEIQTSKETGSQYLFVYKDNTPATYMNQK